MTKVNMGHYVKHKDKDNPHGVTTFGDEIKPHIELIKEDFEDYQNKIEFANTYLRQFPNWRLKQFMYVCMTPYCREGQLLVPAEFSATVFSFAGGIVGTASGFIDPGGVPFGQTGEVTLACAENALPFPGRFEESDVDPRLRHTPSSFLELISQLADKFDLKLGIDVLMFATRADGPVVNSCLKWIQEKTKSELGIQVMRMEILLMQMSRINTSPNFKESSGVIEYEGGAAHFMFNTRYDFKDSLACAWHKLDDNEGKVDKCSKSLSQRRIYNALYYLCHLYGTVLKVPTHVPA